MSNFLRGQRGDPIGRGCPSLGGNANFLAGTKKKAKATKRQDTETATSSPSTRTQENLEGACKSRALSQPAGLSSTPRTSSLQSIVLLTIRLAPFFPMQLPYYYYDCRPLTPLQSKYLPCASKAARKSPHSGPAPISGATTQRAWPASFPLASRNGGRRPCRYEAGRDLRHGAGHGNRAR